MAMLVYDGAQIELTGECVLGRQRDCGVVLRDGASSRRHARVFQADGVWWVEDMGSANGTRRNGARIEGRQALRNGDAIRVGEAEVLFCCAERESAPEPAATARRVALDPQSLAGRQVAGYTVTELMGRSAMGFLYRAKQLSLQRDVALKVFARKVTEDDSDFPARFQDLASKAGSLRHDGFVQLHENGVEDGLVWYSMELIQGDTLALLLERESRFAPELALLICERLAQAMAEAHAAGIVHRDLAPRTLMLNAEGKVKILDLGIAAMLGRGRDRNRPEAAWHLPPEVVSNPPSPADDAYSVGCILHHLLTGQPPFAGDTAEAVRTAHRNAEIPSLRAAVPALPAAADELFQALLTKNPDWRLTGMAEIAGRLRVARGALSAGAKAEGEAKQLGGRSLAAKATSDRRALHRTLVLSGIALALLIGWLVVPGLARTLRATTAAAEPVPPPRPAQPIRPVDPRPPRPTQPTATVDPALVEVRDLRQRLAQAGTLGWPRLEEQAAALAQRLPAVSPAGAELRLVREHLAEDAERWYRAQLAALPPPGPGTTGTRLTALSRLRDEAGAAERVEADVRYQEELAILVQRLAEARRHARRIMEAGRAAELPAVATALAEHFAGTPVSGLQRQFATLCSEAAGVAAIWNTDWRTTSIGFDRQRGERALAAGAALLLAGDPARARRMLLADPQLSQGTLMRRREALMGGLAAVLTFDEPGDLQYIEVLAGEPVLGGGALAGRRDDAVGLAATVPVGGADWLAELTLGLAGGSAEAILSCVAEGEPAFMLRLAEGRSLLRHGRDERAIHLPVAGQRRLRLSCRAGELLVVIDGRETARYARSEVPDGAQLRLEIAGADWRLEELHVVGGR